MVDRPGDLAVRGVEDIAARLHLDGIAGERVNLGESGAGQGRDAESGDNGKLAGHDGLLE